jgi:hypothetical protein
MKLNVPLPDVNIPKLPPTPKRALALKDVPGIPDIIPKKSIPLPDVNVPKLPNIPKRPNIPLSVDFISRGISKLPGIPDILPKKKIPVPDVFIPKLPATPAQKCPLDAVPT